MTTSEPFASSLTPEEEAKIKELAAAVAPTVQARSLILSLPPTS